MIKRLLLTICFFIEELLISILCIYILIYWFCNLFEKGYIYNYILVLLIGVLIGCKIKKWAIKILKSSKNN